MGKKNNWKRARPFSGWLALGVLMACFAPLGSAFAADAGNGVSGESAGCSANRLNPGDSKRTINVNGQTRSYFLHVPRSYTGATAVPLIVDYHGHGGNGEGEKNGSGFAGQAETSGFIVAYPDGLGGNWDYHVGGGVNDLGFSKAIIKDLGDEGCIDTNRVYAAGFSQGGGMSYGVACYDADAFAAVVSSSFDLYDGQQCNPARPISVLSFRGTNDPLAKYDGSPGFQPDGPFVGAKETLKRWAAINHCSGSPSMDSSGCETYTDCDGGTQVGLCTIQGGGHLSGDPRTSWDFLKQFSLAGNGNNDNTSCTPSTITPYVQVDDGNWQQTASVTVDAGAKVTFGPQPMAGISWSWSGGGTSSTTREQTIYPSSSLTATATYTNNCGAESTQKFTVNLNQDSTPNQDPEPEPTLAPSDRAIENGRYNIVSSLSGLYLDVYGARMDDGTNVIQYTNNGGANQQFDVEALEDGTYSIRAAHSGKALEVSQGNASDGAELSQGTYTGGQNQRWRIEEVDDGVYSITSALSNDMVIDVWEMSTSAGGDVKLYGWWGGSNQQWSFVKVGDSQNPNPNPVPNPNPNPVPDPEPNPNPNQNASSGCGKNPGLSSGRRSMTVDGAHREYIIDLPDNYDRNKPYRLIFAWHWLGGNAGAVAGGGYYGLRDQARREAILVAPDRYNVNGQDDSGWPNTNGRDMKFLRAMLGEIKGSLCVDNDRVFSTGWSYGGMMSLAVGREMAGTIRAIAPMSGALFTPFNDNGKPTAAWIAHGRYDDFVTFNTVGIQARDHYVKANHCSNNTVTYAPTPWCVEYQGCDPGAPVIWCVHNGGHVTPDNAGVDIWKFFKQF
jgi:poly(3-hydroxybutyrate) depolymerase